MSLAKITSWTVEDIVPTISEGDCVFTMDGVSEAPDGGYLLSLSATRQILVTEKFEMALMVLGHAEIREQLELRMKEMIEKAKKELGVTT